MDVTFESWPFQDFPSEAGRTMRTCVRSAFTPLAISGLLVFGCPRLWRNWSTRTVQVRVGESPWRFESSQPHWSEVRTRAAPTPECSSSRPPARIRAAFTPPGARPTASPGPSERGQDQDVAIGKRAAELVGAVETGRPGHLDVEQRDVGRGRDRGRDDLVATRRLGDHLDVGLQVEQAREPPRTIVWSSAMSTRITAAPLQSRRQHPRHGRGTGTVTARR